jgi:SAM-dependent methyltransferase
MNQNNNFVMEKYDSQWKISYLESEIANCPDYDLFHILQKYVTRDKKILDAGCGLGRWVFYYHRLGYNIIGIDWSQKTVDMLKAYDSNVKIFQGDVRKTTFKDEEFDIILSLGAVENTIEGPENALADSYRILKEGGLLIITVTMLSLTRKFLNLFKDHLTVIKALFRDKYKELKLLKSKSISNLYMNILFENNNYNFFDYKFPLETFISYIEAAGFQILETKIAFYEEGSYQDLGSLVGSWDYNKGKFEKNIFGRTLYKLFPKLFPHMICCVAKKPNNK